jgi:PKD repeat protein
MCFATLIPAHSQCPQPAFTLPDTVCINEPFNITNNSTGAMRYEWDFCSGDLGEKPTATELLTAPGANTPADIATVFDGANWFGFFFSRDNNVFFRLNYGNSLENTPTVVNIGNLGGVINRPEPITFIKEGGNWYAFTANSIGNSNLIRLDFGTTLTNTPTVIDLSNFGGLLNMPRGLKIEKVSSEYIAVITNWGDNTLTLINFGNSIVNPLSSDQIRKTPPFAGTNNQLLHTAVINDCGNWYGLTSSYGNNSLFKLNFGQSLFNIPSVINLTPAIPAIVNPSNIVLVKEQGYIGMIATGPGNIVKMDFGLNLNNLTPVVTNYGNQGISGMFSLTLNRIPSGWIGMSISNTGNKLYKIYFSAPCSANTSFSSEAFPATIAYNKAGMQKIYYKEQITENESNIFIDSVYVRPQLTVDFKAGGPSNLFQAQYPQGVKIVSFSWNFGDGTTANGNPVQHNYVDDGNYEVTLTLQEVCGQTKSVTKTIGVANQAVLQCPGTLFSVPDTVCINEPVSVGNQTVGATRYQWDFCSGDFNTHPLMQIVSTVTSAAVPSDITTVFDGTNWFGFVCSRNNSAILRLNYGTSLDNIPAVTNLGNIGGQFNFPNGIKLFKEGSNWYGLVVNIFGNSANNLLKLDFGSSLTNTPAVINISSVSPALNQPRGIDIVQDNGKLIVAIANYGGKKITLVNFGSSINNSPDKSDISHIGGFQDELAKISLIKHCNDWYAFAIGTNVYRLDFSSDLMSVPAISNVTDALNIDGISNIKFYQEKDIMAVAVTRFGKVHLLNFGNDIANTPVAVKNISTNGIVNDLESLELIRTGTDFHGFVVDWNSNRLVKLTYTNNCHSTVTTSASQHPDDFSYARTGWNLITLTAFDTNGNIRSYTDSVFVRPAIPADFTATYLCEGSATRFSSPVTAPGNKAKAWYWEFGDGYTSVEENPEHLFDAPGKKNVKLTITDVCNKTTTFTKEITIYRSSTPDFIAPSEICSSQLIAFKDVSSVIDDTIVSWQWDFGNGQGSTEQEPVYAYAGAGNYTITLTITGKSGCKVSVAKAIAVKPGAIVDFSVQNTCLGNETAFTDLTEFSGETSFMSRVWEFGDGETSELPNPVHTYQASGNYPVTLTVQNNIGCSISYTRTIVISLPPDPDFSFSLACTGEATSFFDETTLPQGQIVSWEWDFGEAVRDTNNYSDQRNPTHVFAREGNYTVRLKVHTTYGCVDSVSRTIQVISSPQSSFAYQLNCDTREILFSDQTLATADNPVTGWYWDFGDGNTSQLQHPVHTYSKPGRYTVQLITTALSRCTNNYSRTVQVSNKPVPDFTLSGSLCINNTLVFTDKSVVDESDYIISREWDFGIFGSSTAEQPSVTFTSAEATEVPVSLKITTFAGCQVIVSRNISLQASPGAGFTYRIPSVLDPLQVQFAGQVSGEVVTYQWDFGDGKESKEKNPVHRYEQSGTYTVVFTAENARGCRSSREEILAVSTVSDSFKLKLENIEVTPVNGMLQVTAYIRNTSSFAIEELLFSTQAGHQAVIQTNWQGNLQPGKGMKYSYSIPSGHVASVCVMVKDVARNTASNKQCAGLAEKFMVLEPYPNPAHTVIHQPLILPANANVEISLTDILGQPYGQFFTGIVNSGYREIPLQVMHLKPGIYFIRCSAGGAVFSKKVLIQ